MIRITSEYLRKGDVAILKRFAIWVLSKMVRPSVLRNSNISIHVVNKEDLVRGEEMMDLKDWGAWVNYRGVFNGKKKFDMVLNARRVNRKAKQPMFRLKGLMLDMAHELVHIKQYLNNELFDYVDGKARYKGEVFHLGHTEDEEAYFNSPWEIEAYGREYGFYKMFKKMFTQEQKKKSKR